MKLAVAVMLLLVTVGEPTRAIGQPPPADLGKKVDALENRVNDLDKAVKAAIAQPPRPGGAGGGVNPTTAAAGAGKAAADAGKAAADAAKAAADAGKAASDTAKAAADTKAVVDAAKAAADANSIDTRLKAIEAGLKATEKNSKMAGSSMFWVLVLTVALVAVSGVVLASSTRALRDTKEKLLREAQAVTGIYGRPLVSAVTPNQGVVTGNTPITITGRGFQLGATVRLGGSVATAVSVVTAETITALTPPGAVGKVALTVENRDGATDTLSNAFTYQRPAPVVAGITPIAAPANTLITIWGANFFEIPPDKRITLTMDGVNVPVTYVSENQLTANSPPTPANAAGQLARIVVKNPDDQSSPEKRYFTYP